MAELKDFRVQNAEDAEQIEVGDIVRSYDFGYKDDIYVVGIVVSDTKMVEGCPRYELLGLERVINGESSDIWADALYFIPPRNGVYVLTGGYTNGVRKADDETAKKWRAKLAELQGA